MAEKELLVLLVDLELKEEIAFLVHSLHMAVEQVVEMVVQVLLVDLVVVLEIQTLLDLQVQQDKEIVEESSTS